MVNVKRFCELMNHHEGVFYELFWCYNDLTDKQHQNLCKITSQEQIEEFISLCLNDMINVDKITKEGWLS